MGLADNRIPHELNGHIHPAVRSACSIPVRQQRLSSVRHVYAGKHNSRHFLESVELCWQQTPPKLSGRRFWIERASSYSTPSIRAGRICFVSTRIRKIRLVQMVLPIPHRSSDPNTTVILMREPDIKSASLASFVHRLSDFIG